MLANFKKQIALPQDHGSWVFILTPLLVGIFASGTFNYATFNLIIAAMSAFMIRQPITVIVKVISGRRPNTDLPPARFWALVYGIISALALTALILAGFGYILYLAIPAAPVFAWHLWLVSQRSERKQAGIEIVATGVLSLAAPAAYWVGLGEYNPLGWWLLVWTWLQAAASIVYAYLRLEQRELKQDQATGQERSVLWKMGRRALVYTSFNLCASLLLGWANLIPQLIFIPFLIQWLETLWGITHPSIGWKPVRIGMRQFVVSTLWTILFIICWRTSWTN
ncbi:MAG: YwiC-like family protein [Anaerolineales bacterium]|uniref:YwiC-like family protein n=1 Tax=Candidatus Villigracilis proximus TaxID=3140683 RepID=UPI003135D918|nr:YwiC-like family protein [Anaerolineales bacterium]